MNLERYDYERKRTYKEYFFYSEGPKGRILKVVRFILVYGYPASYYNIIMGDWNKELNDIDDLSVSNNGDAEKVLATIAGIILDFTGIFNNAKVHVIGSTFSRTRRYQIGVNKFRHEIEKIFYVYGRIGEEWMPFQKNTNYDAFFIIRKEPENVILEEQTESYMSTSSRKKEEKKRVYNDRTVDGPELLNIHTSPFVRKKMELARQSFEKAPLTEAFLKKHGLM